MNDTANPLFVALLFVLRCIVPLAILFGISYLLRRLGLVAVEVPEPPDDREEEVVTEEAIAAPEETIASAEDAEAPAENPNETPTVEKPKES